MQRHFSLVGHNFSWIKWIGQKLEQQGVGRHRAGSFRNAVRRPCIEIECTCFCEPIKVESKTTQKRTCRLFLQKQSYWKENLDWCWTSEIFFLRFWSIEEMYFLLHSQHVHREKDGAVHFWRIKENLQNHSPHSLHWSDSKWKVCLAGGGNKRRFQYCIGSSGTIVYVRALQGPSGCSLMYPTLQDTLLILDGFFQNINPVGCAINVHSTISSGLIPGGQSLSKKDRQNSLCLLILWTKVTRILMWSTWMYRVMHNTCIKHGWHPVVNRDESSHEQTMLNDVDVSGWSRTNEMKMFVVHGTLLQNKFTPIEFQNQNVFTTFKLGGSLSQQVGKRYRTSEKVFWHQPSVVYIKPCTPRSFRTTTRAHTPLEVQGMGTGIEFFLSWWQCRNIGGLPKNSKRVKKEVASRGLRSNEATRCLQNLGENLRQVTFMNSFNLVTDRSFTADGGLL